ncbi:MAG: rod shape-determining protein RodA [Candidatus Kapabacteria bacterium]|nr:rod shape-determining protein RodA [Candidatus Kapabacteria bacterium]
MAFDRDRQIQLTRKVNEVFDWGTFFNIIGLLTIGLVSVYSATYIYSSTYESGMSQIFERQALACGIGFILMMVLVFIPDQILKISAIVAYIVSVVLLVLVLFIGKTTYGTQGWLNILGMSIQPSELGKIGVMMGLAYYISRKGTDIRNIRDFIIVVFIVAIPVFLIIKQPDQGTATVYLAMLLGILFWVGFNSFIIFLVVSYPVLLLFALIGPVYSILITLVMSIIVLTFRKRMFISILAIGSFVSIAFITPVVINNLHEYQKKRFESFLNPEKDPLGKAYNAIQSKMAIGSGGFFGKGFLKGTQTQLKYIPKQWTDFIYSVPSEEFGFLGSAIVLLLLSSFILRSLRIAYITENRFHSIIAIGIATVIAYHSIINIGMDIGLLPVMGIPLPFMSSGGTSLMVNCIMGGLLLNFYRRKKLRKLY